MKIKIGTGYQTFSCSITPASGIIISAPEDEELDDDTVAYAICRLFCRSPKLAQPYVWESYQLRLATGKERKVQRHRITIPASLAELPGGWINVKFSVAPTGIQVDRVEFLGSESGSPIYGDAAGAPPTDAEGTELPEDGDAAVPEEAGNPEPAEGADAPDSPEISEEEASTGEDRPEEAGPEPEE